MWLFRRPIKGKALYPGPYMYVKSEFPLLSGVETRAIRFRVKNTQDTN